MPITYKHVKTGRMVKMLTPQERARNAHMPDRVQRRQKQLIDKMDGSQKWVRVATPDLVGRNAKPAPVVDQAPTDNEPTDDDAQPEVFDKPEPAPNPEAEADMSDPGKDDAAPAEPAADELPDGPKFTTRVVKKS